MKPLGLPIGSVRAILALALTGAVIGLAFLGRVDAKDLIILATMALAFYFVGRSGASG